ncbi:hypothetical protein LOTGIDRAFT_234258 [Lottia gigantea]|uniref:Annexin n=1 Tax=Lottia gigantea TaxID=225164 RepID=V4A3V9_LOTGI|nr:hypothetical protein LOTGIDRAFT_234258 [Lottia gigantea]ESO89675.1 hypothetical protein LOTGIDRAFT_234258 [Lottia gigantea]
MAAVYHEGTIKGVEPDTFNAEKPAERLRTAMKKLGTDESEIIKVLCEHNNYQRQLIKTMYKTMYGRDLVEDLESELSGHFEELCLGLMMPSRCFDAYCLRHAMKRIGTKEIVLTDILASRSNCEIQEIKQVYKNDLYQVELEDDIKSDVSGDYLRVLIGLLQANRDDTQSVDVTLVDKDVQDLKEAGINQTGTDEDTFTRILVRRSIPHLREVFEKYDNLEGAVISETSGDLQKAYLSIYRYVKDPLEYYAGCFRESFSGPGTDDERLIQLVVSHSEIDLKDISLVYQRIYKQSLTEAIQDECRGDYGKLILKIVTPGDDACTPES